jgi:hypothetical protein
VPISDADLSNIFGAARRARDVFTRSSGRFGVGLWIPRQFLQLLACGLASYRADIDLDGVGPLGTLPVGEMFQKIGAAHRVGQP